MTKANKASIENQENKLVQVQSQPVSAQTSGEVGGQSGYMPAFPTKRQIQEYEEFLSNYNEFIDRQLKVNTDYGIIPGVDKPTLYKPGAEKLEKLFFLTHEKQAIEKTVRDDFIRYTYRTTVYDKQGNVKATSEGTCNSKETKYRYINVKEKDATPEQKQKGQRIQKKGKYGVYVVYRIEREDYWDIENTIMKMAQKRSYVGAILEATGSSGRFTQDVEDMDEINSNANKTEKCATQYADRQSEPRAQKSFEQLFCQRCQQNGAKMPISRAVADYSHKNYGFLLCRECQEAAKKAQSQEQTARDVRRGSFC